MDLNKILSELRAERDELDQAIIALQGLAQNAPRRGRPPKWLAAAKSGATADAGVRPKRVVSPEARKKMAEAQKRRWAAVRKAKKAA